MTLHKAHNILAALVTVLAGSAWISDAADQAQALNTANTLKVPANFPAGAMKPQPLSAIGQRLAAIKLAAPAVTTKSGSGQPDAPKVAPSVTLAWNPSPDPRSILWYRLYYGPSSRSYTNYVQTQTTNATVTDLPNGGTVYFAATVGVAVGQGDWLESDFSAEVSYVVPWQPVGIAVLTVQPQMSMDQGVNWTDIGPPWLTTNPAAPVVLFKLRTQVDHY